MKCWYCGVNESSQQHLCAHCGAPLTLPRVAPTRNPASTPVEIMMIPAGTFTLARSKGTSGDIVVYRICGDGAFAWVGSTWKDGLRDAPRAVRERAYEMAQTPS